MKRIGIKYCGNCNPWIDSDEIVKTLQNQLKDGYALVPWDAGDIRLILIMSGCPADCAQRPDFHGPVIHVAGYYIDNILYDQNSFFQTLPQRIKDNLG
ncbi:MAG: hypothetical protein ACOWWO_07745 [Peptococcaceae bacterium]